MADLISGYKRIITNRKFEDYKSMKKYFAAFRTNGTKEIIFCGWQLATAGAGVIIDGAQFTHGALIAAEEVAYIATEADDGNQDGKKVWVIYQDSTGAIKAVVEHLLAAGAEAGTEVVHALGNEGVLDTVAACDGTKLILDMTDYNCTTVNDLAGKYLVVYSGDQKGTAHLIASNTVANPTIITIAVACANVNIAADLVQIQEFPCDDFFRAREMYCEVEPLDTKQIVLGTFDIGTVYNAIGCDARYMANSSFFTQPAATCRSFLGKIKASHSIDSTVTEVGGASVFVTFTPIEAYSDGGSADITIELTFSDFLLWEPCIELEPATDVIVKISNVEGAKLSEIFVEVTYLEVY